MSSEKKYINSDFQSFFENNLSSSDPEIYKAINDELLRQQQHIELIASENIVSMRYYKLKALFLLTNMRKVILAKDIIMDVIMSMQQKV